MFNFLKREIKGYLILILNTGYETIPNVKVQISDTNKIGFELQNSYWYKDEVKKIIPLYQKDIKLLNEKGFDLTKYIYMRKIGYDDVLNYSKKKILKLLEF